MHSISVCPCINQLMQEALGCQWNKIDTSHFGERLSLSLFFISICFCLRDLYNTGHAMSVEYAGGNMRVYTFRTMRMSTGRSDLSGGIIWRDIGT